MILFGCIFSAKGYHNLKGSPILNKVTASIFYNVKLYLNKKLVQRKLPHRIQIKKSNLHAQAQLPQGKRGYLKIFSSSLPPVKYLAAHVHVSVKPPLQYFLFYLFITSVSKVMNYLLSPPFHPSFFVYTFPYLLGQGDNRVCSCVSGQIV